MSKEQIINKIQKLLQLADSKKNSSVEEAATAAAKAQALMEKHRIEKAMIDNSKHDLKRLPLIDKGNPEEWKLYLIAAISKHNGCFVIRSETYEKDNIIHVVGESSDIQSVQELYTYIVNELIRLCLANLLSIKNVYGYCPDATYNRSFYLGATATIESRLEQANQQIRNQKLKKAKNKTEQEKINNVLAKLDNRIQKAKDWITNNTKAKIENVSTSNVNNDGYSAGQKAAKTLNLTPKKPELNST